MNLIKHAWVLFMLWCFTLPEAGDSEADPRRQYNTTIFNKTTTGGLSEHKPKTPVFHFNHTEQNVEEIIPLLKNHTIQQFNFSASANVSEPLLIPCMVQRGDFVYTEISMRRNSTRIEWAKGPEEHDSTLSVNEHVVDLMNNYHVYPNNYSLLIKNVSLSSIGYYKCMVYDDKSVHSLFVAVVGLQQKAEEIVQYILEPGKSIELPCHPDLEKSTLPYTKPKYRFEWVTDNDVPIYTEGRFSPHLFVNDPDKTSYSIRNSSLILRRLEPNSDVTFTCHLKDRYTRFKVKVKTLGPANDSSQHGYHEIDAPKDINTNHLLVLDNKGFPKENASFIWVLRAQPYNKSEEIVEVISLNNEVLSPSNSNKYGLTSEGFLVIHKLKSDYQLLYYERYFSTGSSYVYRISMNRTEKSDLAQITWINDTIPARQGEDVLLRCPIADNSKHVWTRNHTELLFITGDAVMERSSLKNFEMSAVDNKSLVIKKFSAELNGLYECISNDFHYLYNVTELGNDTELINETVISEFEIGKPLILTCPPRSVNDSSHFKWTRDGKHLCVDGIRMKEWHDNLKLGGEDMRSLVIKSFSNRDKGLYSCSFLTGKKSATIFNITGQKEIMVIEFGMRNVRLLCPANNKTEKADNGFEWRLESSSSNSSSFINFNTSSHPTIILFVNGDKFMPISLYRNFYDIDENGSLIIKLINSPQYGIYTCRRFSGLQYVYQINRKVTSEKKTLELVPGASVELPCPPMGPKDYESDVIRWTIRLKKNNFNKEYQFVNEKLMLSNANQPVEPELPQYVQISKDRQLLEVSNLTANIHPGSYICTRILSQSEFHYRITTGAKNKKKKLIKVE